MPMDAEIDDSLEMVEQKSSGEQTSEEEEPQALLTVFYPNRQSVPYRLHLGVNVIGRQSSFAQRDAVRLHEWSLEYSGASVHGIFLESSSVSSAHAAVFLEACGECCFVKDLNSRNKTFVKRGGKHVALNPDHKQPLQSSDILTFGTLKCRVSFGGGSEGAAPSGGSPTFRGNLQLRTSSRAISIGQRTASPGIPLGKSSSLDKCPSLHEWFQPPGRNSGGGPEPSPFASTSTGRGWGGEEAVGGGATDTVLNPMPSFGFEATIQEADENTSSSAEPETPRIDKPVAFQSPKVRSQQTPFASRQSEAALAPMLEDDEDLAETIVDMSELQEPGSGKLAAQEKESSTHRSSLEMGAEMLTQLKTVPLKGTIAGEMPDLTRVSPPTSPPETPGTEDLNPTPQGSPSTSADDHLLVATPPSVFKGAQESGRPMRARQKSPGPKRSRSGGRGMSPERPRSKSPRLQQGFYVDSQPTASAERHMGMSAMRDAVRDIWSDM